MNLKPRNHVVLALIQLKKKSGAHGKSEKAKRRQNKVHLQKKQDE